VLSRWIPAQFLENASFGWLHGTYKYINFISYLNGKAELPLPLSKQHTKKKLVHRDANHGLGQKLTELRGLDSGKCRAYLLFDCKIKWR